MADRYDPKRVLLKTCENQCACMHDALRTLHLIIRNRLFTHPLSFASELPETTEIVPRLYLSRREEANPDGVLLPGLLDLYPSVVATIEDVADSPPWTISLIRTPQGRRCLLESSRGIRQISVILLKL